MSYHGQQWVYKFKFSCILLSDAERFRCRAKKKKKISFSLGQGNLFLLAILTSSNCDIVRRILELDWTVNMFLTFLFSWEITDHQIMVICKICPVDFFPWPEGLDVYLTIACSKSRWKEHFCSVVIHSFYWDPPT